MSTHDSCSIAIGLLLALLLTRGKEGGAAIARASGCVVGALTGGRLPDALEPAIHSWHRNFFHSAALLGGIGSAHVVPNRAMEWLESMEVHATNCRKHRLTLNLESEECQQLWMSEMVAEFLIGFFTVLPTSYAAHLVLDGATPRGLPFV